MAVGVGVLASEVSKIVSYMKRVGFFSSYIRGGSSLRHILSLFTLFSVLAHAQGDNIGSSCQALSKLQLPDTLIESAEMISAGRFQMPPPFQTIAPKGVLLPVFCRVIGTIAPANGFEVWLPQKDVWNGRLKSEGGGGLNGFINYAAMAPSLQSGYVTASTDTGHKTGETAWLRDVSGMRNYGYRAIHEMTVQTKAIIKAYYGRAQNYSYFNGCSTGGRQGLMEAQRYPEDYDGIVSGAPVNYFVATHYTQLWIALAAKPVDDATLLKEEDLSMLGKAVLNQCDAIDGVTDGLLEDPRKCQFNPDSLLCSDAKQTNCFSAEQIGAIKKIYQGPVSPVNRQRLHPSLLPGGEAGPEGWWILTTRPGIFEIPKLFFSHSVMDSPEWNWRTFDFDKDIDLAFRKTGAMLEATDPNLDPFRAHGGKLILYHGWNDPVIFPGGSVNYYNSVANHLPMTKPERAAEKTAEFFRLFMAPGVAHCRGGPGPDELDAQSAIEDWVERGIAPQKIIATKRNGKQVSRTRPLCPYPKTAKYIGDGDINQAKNFICSE